MEKTKRKELSGRRLFLFLSEGTPRLLLVFDCALLYLPNSVVPRKTWKVTLFSQRQKEQSASKMSVLNDNALAAVARGDNF